MSLEIIISPKAGKAYDAIIDQLIERWGYNIVEKLEAKITKCFHIIANDPYIYPLNDDVTEVRKCVLHKNCSMLYKIENNEIVIITFWDNRQDPIFNF